MRGNLRLPRRGSAHLRPDKNSLLMMENKALSFESLRLRAVRNRRPQKLALFLSVLINMEPFDHRIRDPKQLVKF